MKIAVTSKGKEIESETDKRFGRAYGFIIFDTEKNDFSFVNNTQNLEASQGAGIQAAQIISEQDADVLLTGHCGPKAFKVLSAAGVKIYTGAEGSVQEALNNFNNGELQEITSADVEGHWV